jgi:hypothetical protein
VFNFEEAHESKCGGTHEELCLGDCFKTIREIYDRFHVVFKDQACGFFYR